MPGEKLETRTMTIDALNAPRYAWGTASECWMLSNAPGLTVKLERMPPGESECAHHHERTQQFFFILNGMAEFLLGQETWHLCPEQGVHVAPGQVHRISNPGTEDLRFLVISELDTANDRVDAPGI